ncbi:MAG TPA: cytochrome c3 family protein [Candidatus Acidoferrales bacterium]|nr:cytochrome c3 family protein [Candidatus Acidoferrales bacterium]
MATRTNRKIFRTRLLALAMLLLPALLFGADQLKNADCLDCHTDPSNKRTVNGHPEPMALFPTNGFAKSVHAALDCVDCHDGIKELVHDKNVPPPNCTGCHDKEGKDYATSIHGMSHAMGASGAAQCWDCHGSHEIVPVKNVDSPVFKMNLPQTCAKCHSNTNLTKEYQIEFPEAASQFMDSIHGRALLKMGLIVAPSCDDCHGSHKIKRSIDRDSPINHANVAKTCGKCHVGVEATYDQSVHGQLLAQGDPRGPVCIDCHSAHEISNPEGNKFKALSDQRCGKCHQDRLEHYRETYHGKAMLLGKPNEAPEVAACYDCHGFHDVLPISNPNSHLSARNILVTCQKCHPTATAKFTEYKPHANPLDAKNYPLLHVVFLAMTGLLIGTFSFFGLHTLAWLVRAVWLYLHDSKTFREAKIKTQEGDEWFTRFVPFERFLHFLVVTSFLTLVVTGMPLKFYYTGWAKFIFSLIGGPDTARMLHRFAALITFLYFSLHLISLVGKAWKGRGNIRNPETGRPQFRRLFQVLFGPDSMVPTWQDAKDLIDHNKWFFGKGPKPQFDRWTYWEKFDYFAVFWGVAIIGFSGLVMWFPEFFTRFLPGWAINIALILHSDEALLAAGFIFSIHFFNTHFRIEKFPMDTVIFSGRVSKAEMLHERRRWYDRLVAAGKLDDFRVRDEWIRWKNIAKSFGYFFFGLGLVLLVLIIYAMLSRLAH